MKLSSCILLALLPFSVFAQAYKNPLQRAQRNAYVIQQGEVTNLSQVIAVALEKNYQIRIARTQEQITQFNATYGNAGFLPVLTGNLSRNNSRQNLQQEYFSAQAPTNVSGVLNANTVVGVNLNWTLFNGLGMFILYDQLAEQTRLAEVTTRANVEQTVANIATSYYNVVRQLQRLLTLRQALDISRDRLELARDSYEVGTRSKVDFLSAQVDYNTDSSALLTQTQLLQAAKIGLNQLLVRDPNTEFAVRDSIIARNNLAIEPLRESLSTNNPLLIAAVYNRHIADLSIKLAKAQQLPTVTFQSGYNYTSINNQGGFGVRSANNTTLLYNLQASVPIFNGLNQRRLNQVARANSVIAEYQEANQRIVLQTALEQTYSQYVNNLNLLNLEVQNNQLANQNVDIAYDRYRIGNSTFVEFRDVQRNAIDAQNRLIEAEYNAKAAEIELLRLSSTITRDLAQ
ncbi:TolC family protein [Spirosoma pollinicola]|uniref:Transporter n=1 Tax=Spirosoma pollinicola TaxID=2057025 RepID=A0A2K8YV35_9BACT|nr:TolC family protein [Spirosoma pollinicola]AUD01481.1 transporter [Spirosoma pollinicola]